MSRPRQQAGHNCALPSSPVAGGGGRATIYGRSYALGIRRACHYWRVRHPNESLYIDEFKLETEMDSDSSMEAPESDEDY